MYVSLVNESDGIYALMTNIVIVKSHLYIQIIMVATTVHMHNNIYVAT